MEDEQLNTTCTGFCYFVPITGRDNSIDNWQCLECGELELTQNEKDA